MREAIGTTYVLNFIIVFFALFIFIFIGTLSYTKAFKVKNKIIDIIENHDGDIEASLGLNMDVENEINSKLNEIGYRISNNQTCETDGRFSDASPINKRGTSTYRYCLYKFTTDRGNYYGVVSYIYFEIPIIGVKLEFPVYGETKVFTELTKGWMKWMLL